MKEQNRTELSMINPPMSSLLDKVDSRYTLVVMAAKRARQITEGASKLTDCPSDKPVTVAVSEISENRIKYVRTRTGIK